MGPEQTTLPPPTGTPVVPPRVAVPSAPAARIAPPPPPPAPPPLVAPAGSPQLGRQDRGKDSALVGSTVSRREKPLVDVVHQRRRTGWFKVIVSWALLGAVVVLGMKLYPRVKENLTLDTAHVSASPDGYLIADGPVSWRMPARPRKILVHLAGQTEGLTGFRMSIDSGTLDIDVKNTPSERTPTVLQRFCDVQFEHRTSTLGPAISDQSSFTDGIYRRTASWHQGEKFVSATCFGHSHSNVLIEATSVHSRWAPYAQAVATVDFST